MVLIIHYFSKFVCYFNYCRRLQKTKLTSSCCSLAVQATWISPGILDVKGVVTILHCTNEGMKSDCHPPLKDTAIQGENDLT